MRRIIASVAGLLPTLLALSTPLGVACERPVGTDPPRDTQPDVPGVFGGRCTDDGFCNDPLICANDICVTDPNAAGEGEGEGEGEGT